MTTIYVLMYVTEYEGSDLCGVYSTPGLAFRAMRTMSAKVEEFNGSVEIEERVLDAPPRFKWERD